MVLVGLIPSSATSPTGSSDECRITAVRPAVRAGTPFLRELRWTPAGPPRSVKGAAGPHHRPEGLMGRHCFSVLVALSSLLPAGPALGQAGAARPDYRNPALPAERRVGDLLSRMT